MQTSYTKVETFGWGKLENYKSIGGTTKSGETNVKISVGDGGEQTGRERQEFSFKFSGGGREILEETMSVNFDHKVNFCSIFSLHINDLSAEIATCFVLYVTQFLCLRVEVNVSLQVAHAVTNPMIFSPSFNSVRL